MDLKTGVFVTLFLLIGGFNCVAEDTVGMTRSMKEILDDINRRYDDFFRYQNYLTERLDRMQHGVADRKEAERDRQKELERARKEFVMSRKARPNDEPLRLRWEAEQKERAAQNEMLRRRYVERREYLESYLNKGRKIPEMKELDLEDY